MTATRLETDGVYVSETQSSLILSWCLPSKVAASWAALWIIQMLMMSSSRSHIDLKKLWCGSGQELAELKCLTPSVRHLDLQCSMKHSVFSDASFTVAWIITATSHLCTNKIMLREERSSGLKMVCALFVMNTKAYSQVHTHTTQCKTVSSHVHFAGGRRITGFPDFLRCVTSLAAAAASHGADETRYWKGACSVSSSVYAFLSVLYL